MTFGVPPVASSLDRVVRGGLCTGCGACAALAPEKVKMSLRGPGWLRPLVSPALDDREDEEIAAACPGVHLEQRTDRRVDHDLWGPLINVRTGHATDEEMRYRASSGGAVSALLVHLLETGAVDRVITNRADPARPYANTVVNTSTRAGVIEAAGSRYAPSSPLTGLKAALATPGRIAFVGKPCDVAALRAWARRNPEINSRVPYVISFFCAGVPSLSGVRAILSALEIKEGDLAAFRFRGHGWPGRATATRADGREVSMSYADSWGGILSKHVQFRCKICPDGSGGFADVVCADAWDCDDAGYPQFEETRGKSLIISRTEKGETLVKAAMTTGALRAEQCPVDKIAAMQPGQLKRKRLALSRLMALPLVGRPLPRFSGFQLGRAALQAGAIENLRSFLGTLRRLVLSGTDR